MEPDRQSSAIFWVKGIAEALSDAGLDVTALFRDAVLDWNALNNPDARLSSEGVSRLWRLAVDRSGKPMIGLSAAARPRPALFDVVGYAMMSAPDLRGILERAERYCRIVCDAATVTVQNDDDGCRVRLAIGDQSEPPWQRYAFDLLSLLSFVQWVVGRDLWPLALELRGGPGDGDGFAANEFRFPFRFGATANAVLFAHADLGRPLPTAHANLAAVHERIADDYLSRLDESAIGRRVRAVLLKHLPDGDPRRGAVARALGLSERTLQRRLEEEGSSFQRLLDETRRELAERYIGQHDLSLAEAAYLLGFNDQSSFFRASKRWFGITPRQYRLRSTTRK